MTNLTLVNIGRKIQYVRNWKADEISGMKLHLVSLTGTKRHDLYRFHIVGIWKNGILVKFIEMIILNDTYYPYLNIPHYSPPVQIKVLYELHICLLFVFTRLRAPIFNDVK